VPGSGPIRLPLPVRHRPDRNPREASGARHTAL